MPVSQLYDKSHLPEQKAARNMLADKYIFLLKYQY